MLKCIEEAWEIELILKANLELFLKNRNRLIHGITMDEQFDIRTHWGREELLVFLSFFDVHARIVKSAFRASYYASIEFALHHWGRPKGIPKKIFGRKQTKEASLFYTFFYTERRRDIGSKSYGGRVPEGPVDVFYIFRAIICITRSETFESPDP